MKRETERRSQLRFCDGYKPVWWDPNDTDETIIQAKALNELWRQKCSQE